MNRIIYAHLEDYFHNMPRQMVQEFIDCYKEALEHYTKDALVNGYCEQCSTPTYRGVCECGKSLNPALYLLTCNMMDVAELSLLRNKNDPKWIKEELIKET